MRKSLRKLRKTYHNGYVVVVAVAIVMFWYGMLGILETFLFPNNKVLSYAIALTLGLFVLFVNDFKLDELE
ncbi:MAG: hypothetical protein CR972_02495 [Candidatus Moraniibacteriota bacterium]|nr:MAG: hypothetical protein CR972_02495 [Candidatus Moranbacteria bacterium]